MRKLWRLLLLLLLPVAAMAEESRLVDTLEGPDYTVLLTAESGARYVSIHTVEDIRSSGPWPESTFFSGIPQDGVIQLQWDDRIAWYSLCPGGEWLLSALQDYSDDFWGVAAPFGMYEPETGRFLVGNMAAGLFDGAAGDALFAMAAAPDRTGWAVVQADAAPLCTAPDGNTLGCLFTGTPLSVLQVQGDWIQVAVAADPRLTGWMRADNLARDDGIAAVTQANPRFTLPEREWTRMPDAPPYCAIGVQGPYLLLWTEEGVHFAAYSTLDR